jgi:uncharacterized protein (DUF1501 family)
MKTANISGPLQAGRREFLRRASLIAASAGTPFAVNLLSIGAASAQTVSDYKALVCVFLNGGNDQSNTVVPYGTDEWNAYFQARPTLAIPRSDLLPLNLLNRSDAPLGLHASLDKLMPLFNQQRVAILANVGTLVYPINKGQWNRGNPTVPTPAQLFSHSDQTGAWQTGLPDRPSLTGWLGRTGDLLASAFNPGSGVSIAMSVAGNTIMLAGNDTIQYQLSTQGAVRVSALASGLYGSSAGSAALRRLMSEPRQSLLENELVKVSSRAINAEALVNNALANTPPFAEFPQTPLGQQLRMVARMIAARGALGQRRQIFFVQQGGYDFHDNLLNDQAARLKQLGDALAAFYQATVNLGVQNNVTTFTASDFGRALQSNGRGSDHGWGGHHFIIGGAVQGNRVYGSFPRVALGAEQDAGQGRLIPTTSVDQYAATLALWFGVSFSDLPIVVPNLGRFATPNLGFMRA